MRKEAMAASSVLTAAAILLSSCNQQTETIQANSGEFAVLFDSNHLQNLDAESKSIVEANLEGISERCKSELPEMIDGSEKYIFAKNANKETFVWAFCDVETDNGAKTMVSLYETVDPYLEDKSINAFLEDLGDGNYGYVDGDGVSHTILKRNNDGYLSVYDYSGNVVSQRSVDNNVLSFWHISTVYGQTEETPEVTPNTTSEATQLPTDVISAIQDSGEQIATSTAEATAESETAINVEGTTGIKSEFLLDGNLEINKEAGNKYYLDFINSLAGNEQNKDYMEQLLGPNPDGAKLLEYLKNNDYTLPPGLNLPYQSRAGHVKIGNNPINESIRLDTLKIVVYGPQQWNNDSNGLKEYISSLKSYGGLWTASSSYSVQCFGWAIDVNDNRLVMVAGAKEVAPEKYPSTVKMTIGGTDGNFDFEKDSLVASGELIQINKILREYNPNSDAFSLVAALSSLCGVQETSGVCENDIIQFFGEGENLFDPGK